MYRDDPMVTVGIRLAASQAQALENLGDRLGKSKSDVVRTL
jgi:predicted DNA-binding protein